MTQAKKPAKKKTVKKRAKSASRRKPAKRSAPLTFPVVGIGSSAGGLDALKRFFEALGDTREAAFVLVQHADPNRDGMIEDRLQRFTKLTVQEAREGTSVQPGFVYLIPPKKQLCIEQGVLWLEDTQPQRGRRSTIDTFFKSLAKDQRQNAVGVIFSGTGSDGSAGVKAIKKAGGLVLVQNVEDAQHGGMPQSALSTHAVDYCSSVEDLAQMLREALSHGTLHALSSDAEADDDILKIIDLIKARRHTDFAFYKRGTLARRISRRAALAQLPSLRAYRELLEGDDAELARLADDLLIGTTRFFRDPEAFEFLAKHVIADICRRDTATPVRIWVSGTATGEEAYSIAMLVSEQLAAANRANRPVQIFATDMDIEALEQAREGRYPLSIAEDVSAERLEKFFTRERNGYRVDQRLRDAVTFAVQNVITDPPFSRVNLIVCRNLLIYLLPDVQKRILNLFHFALNEDGYLFIGPAESVSGRSELFQPIEKRHRVYRRLNRPDARILDFAATPASGSLRYAHARALREPLRLQGQKMLEDHYMPPAVLVNQSLEVVEIYGDISPYLRLQPGRPTMEIVELALPALKPKLRSLLYQRRQLSEPEVSLTTTMADAESGSERPIRLSARLVGRGDPEDEAYLIVFRAQAHAASTLPALEDQIGNEQAARLLEEELRRTRDDLQSTIEQLETANEELKASNEEVMSMNEEFQSTNEELETSKEELQAANEELATVNSQLEEKLQELERRNNDINNLLESTHVGAIFLDRDFRVQLFTPAVTELVKLIASDVGRPFEDISQRFQDGALMADARNVLRTLHPREREIQGPEGRFFLRRILPYRTEDNRIDGVVLTFVDVTERKHAELHRARLAAIVEGSDHAVIGKTLDGIVTEWNRGAESIYGYTAEEVIGGSISIIFPPEISHESMKPVYDTLRAGKRVPPMEVERVRKDGVRLNMVVTISPIIDESGRVVGASTIATDITAQKKLEAQLQHLNMELEARVAERTRQVEERAENVRHLAMQMTRAEQDERRRIARILHDNVQQLHIAAKMRIQQARLEPSIERLRKLLADAMDLLDQATHASRTLTVELYPPVLSHSGVVPALEWLRQWMKEQHELQVALTAAGDAEPANSDLAHVVFEFAREMLLNVVKHSGTTSAEVSLVRDDTLLHLRVRDEGNGCDAETIGQRKVDGYGLASMRERIEFMGGKLEVCTGPGDGFCVDAWFREGELREEVSTAAREKRVRVYEDAVVEGKVRTVVVDDHDVVRSGIVTVLQDSRRVAVVGEASDGEAGIRLAKMLQPDVVLMDVNMPRLNGIEATRMIVAQCPSVAVVGLSVNDDAQTIDEMRAAGAVGYVIKGGSSGDLIEAVAAASTAKRPSSESLRQY